MFQKLTSVSLSSPPPRLTRVPTPGTATRVSSVPARRPSGSAAAPRGGALLVSMLVGREFLTFPFFF